MRVVCGVLAVLFVCVGRTYAQGALPSQAEYEPPDGKGRVVIVVSGQTGPSNYAHYAKDVAKKGYYTVLVDGNDFWIKGGGGDALLKGVIERAQQSRHALPGKVAVIGFSMGGGVALGYATQMPELVSAIAVSYPTTSFIRNPEQFVARIKVPTLMFAGGRDTYNNCCLIETARKLADAAKTSTTKGMLEVVEYPDGEHGWTIIRFRSYRDDYTTDGLRRTVDHLRQYSAP
jgi:dienelactone hydrolase